MIHWRIPKWMLIWKKMHKIGLLFRNIYEIKTGFNIKYNPIHNDGS